MMSAFRYGWVAGVVLIFSLLPGCAATVPAIPAATLNKISALPHVKVDLDFRQHSEWSPARREKAQSAARILEAVLNSTAFSRRLENRRDLLRTEGYSTVEILHIIRSGKSLERLRSGDSNVSNTIALALSVAPATPEFAHLVGFTDLDTGIIYTRKEWFDEQSICQLAGHFAHEYMHVIGFTHTTFNHPWRRLSVPYAIGEMVAELAEKNSSVQCAHHKTQSIV